MKLRITEQQVKSLIQNLNEQDLDLGAETPNLSKLAKIMSAGADTDTPTGTIPDTTPNFVPKIPVGDKMMHPLGHAGNITSNFGYRTGSIGSSNHQGIDISTPSGSPVYAPLDGVVISSRDTTPNACGGFVKLDHDSIETKFCHLSQLNVKEGQQVKKGQIIGYSGGGQNDPMRGTATGPHLHYEIRNKSGIAMNPTTVQPNLA
jgi:murein DD-endopeptidase MepM/ murein hydrolase activator NlpD